MAEADLLIHVVDGSDPDPKGQIAAVREVLLEIGADQVPELIVLNKADLVSPTSAERLANLYPDSVMVSGLAGTGLANMLETVGALLESGLVTMTLEIPYTRGDIAAAAHRVGEVIEEKADEKGLILEVRLPPPVVAGFEEFRR